MKALVKVKKVITKEIVVSIEVDDIEEGIEKYKKEDYYGRDVETIKDKVDEEIISVMLVKD